MKQVKYNDGSPSREVDNWEDSGEEEMEELHKIAEIKLCCLRATDKINNICDLVSVCSTSLLNYDFDYRKQISHVLFFFVFDELKILQKELDQCQLK